MQEINQKQVNQILGYGKIIPVLVGTYEKDEGEHKKGDAKVLNIHITPIGIGSIPEFTELVDKFMNLGDKFLDDAKASAEFTNVGYQIIKLSTKKMHPDFTDEYIKEIFDISFLAESVKIAIDINSFTSKINELTKPIQKLNELSEQQKKIKN